MKPITTLLLILLMNQVLSSQPVYEKKYNNNANENVLLTKTGDKKYTLKYHTMTLGESKFADADKFKKEIFERVKKALLDKHGDEQAAVIDFAEKFSVKATEGISNPKEVNSVLEKKDLSGRYAVNMILTANNGYLYYFSDKDQNGNAPTDLFYKDNGNYKFADVKISSSPDIDSIVVNFLSIVQFISKNKEVVVPNVFLKDDGTQQLLVFESNKVETTVPIKKAVFDMIKGTEKSKNGNITTFGLKEEKKEVVNGDVKDDKEKSKEKSYGKVEKIIEDQSYIFELIKKDDYFFLTLTGLEVKVTKDGSDNPVKDGTGNNTFTKGSQVTKLSERKILSLDDNEAGFKLMADNHIKSVNESIDISKAEYTGKIKEVYNFFKEKVKQKDATDKEEKIKNDIIKQSKLEEIANEEETKAKVGTIILRKETINVYRNNTVIGTAKIDSVKFSIEGGKLSRRLLYVETADQGTFFNRQAPIPVLKINTSKRKNDKLVNLDGSGSYIKMGELLRYLPDGGYFPDDADNIVLKKDDPKKDLSALANLNSMVNFSLYTDLAGLLGRRPNGLLITDVTGRFITNAGNLFGDVTLFSFIEGNVTISKFDSKFKSFDSTGIKPGMGGQMDTVDRMRLMQTAWLKGNMKFNLFSIKAFTHQYLHINVGARINVVNGDSLYKTETDIIMFEYYPEAVYSVNRLKNFGMDISIKWILQRIADKERFSNKHTETIFNPQIAFFYYPFKNPSSTIYLRFNYFANHSKEANNFYQLQFGWRSGLKLSKKD